jgi:hypothetical protein
VPVLVCPSLPLSFVSPARLLLPSLRVTP